MTRIPVIARIALAAICLAATAGTSAQSTASVSGRVITDDASQRPVPRAIVTLSGAALALGRSVVTDELGAFTCAGLPEGRFAITVSKNNYLTTSYGAKRPGRPGTPITVAAGQHVSDLVVRLGRTAAITGAIRAENGEPAPGIQVSAVRLDQMGDLSQTPATDISGDRGEYRVSGLTPGEYVVVATVGYTAGAMQSRGGIDVRSTDEVDAILSQLQRGDRRVSTSASPPAAAAPPPQERPTYTYAPIYYPGTPFPGDAAKVMLELRDERRGVDFAVTLARASRVEGVVLSTDGAAMPSVKLTMRRQGASLPFRLASGPASSGEATAADGRFWFTGVEPGQWTLTARSSVFRPTNPDQTGDWDVFYGMADLIVNGEDLSGVVLKMQPAIKFSGRIRIDQSTPASTLELPRTQVTVTPREAGSMAANSAAGASESALVRPDGSFDIPNLSPGSYRVTAAFPRAGDWWLRSAIVKGVDVLDVLLELGAGGDISGAVLTISNRHTELSGTLQGPTGAPASEYFVIAFPADRALWRAGSRRVQVTRPSTDGTFAIQNLPGGDYLVAALTDVEPNEWNDPAFLQQLVPGSVKLALADGEKKVQNLGINGGAGFSRP